ncbi:MAG: PAS domain-containing protein [Vicinamibacterales bacterium]
MAATPTAVARRPGWSLRARLLFLSAIVPLPLVALLAWGLVNERADALQGARMAVARRARHVSDEQRVLLERSESLAAVLGNMPAVRREDWAEVDRILSGVVHRFHEYSNIRIADAQSTVRASARTGDAALPADSTSIADAVRTGQFKMSAPFVGRTDGHRVVDVAYPIRRHGGATGGAVVMTIELAELGRVPADALTPGAAVTVIGERGTVVTRTPADRIAPGAAVDASLLEHFRSDANAGFIESDRLDGVPSMIGYEVLPLSPGGAPVVVAVSLPRHVVMAPIVERTGALALGACLVVGLVLGVGTVGSRRLIGDPLNVLHAVQDRLARGEFQARAPDGLLGDRSEFGEMARMLATLGARLQARDADQAASRARQRAILDAFPGVAVLVAPDLRIVEFNAAPLAALGISRESVVGRRIDELTWDHPGDAVQASQRVERALAGEVVREDLVGSLRTSGRRVIDLHLTPVRDAAGVVEYVAVFGVDVTDARANSEALRESRRELAEILESAPVALAYITVREDGSFRLSAVNPAFLRLFHLPPLPAEGRCLSEIRPAELRESVLRRCRQAVTQGTGVAWEESIAWASMDGDTMREGSASCFQLSLSPFVEEHGRCTRLIGSVHDVTEQRSAAEAVREYAARMALIFNTSQDLQMLHRADEHFTIEAVNHALLAMARRRPGSDVDPIGLRRDDYLATLGFPADAIARSRSKLVQVVSQRSRVSYPVELYLPDAQGGPQTFRLEVTISPHCSDSGECTHVLWNAHDVTARWRAEQSLRASEANLRQAEVFAGLGHYQSDEDGSNMLCSEGLKRLFGFSATDTPTRDDFRDRIDPRDRDMVRDSYQLALRAVQPFDCTYRVVLPDGATRTLHARGEFRADPVTGQSRFFSAAIDVSVIKEAEHRLAELNETLELRVAVRTRDLELSNRELESFSYSVSHDLRAPLRAIEGFSHAAIESERATLSADGLALLRRVQAAAQRMGTIIDALLRLARTTREPVLTVPVDISALARSVADELIQANPTRRPEVIVADGLTAVGDPRQLRLALTNLLDNAFKFSARAERPVVEVGCRSMAGRQVFFVRDNGVGFDMARAGALFQPFERMHSPLDYPGTGIGLATVQRVARRHGGSVWAESTPGRGATFFLVLDAPSQDLQERA